jgi:hypothetical protein
VHQSVFNVEGSAEIDDILQKLQLSSSKDGGNVGSTEREGL